MTWFNAYLCSMGFSLILIVIGMIREEHRRNQAPSLTSRTIEMFVTTIVAIIPGFNIVVGLVVAFDDGGGLL